MLSNRYSSIALSLSDCPSLLLKQSDSILFRKLSQTSDPGRSLLILKLNIDLDCLKSDIIYLSSESMSVYSIGLVVWLCLLNTSIATTINCENSPSSWQPGKNMPISDREIVVSTKYDKVDVIVDSRDGVVSSNIKNGGTWEPRNLRTMARFVKIGDTVINIGSHIGLEAIVMGRIAGPTGHLFIFEPYSLTYNMVLKNVYLNKLGDMATVYNVGASNHYAQGYISVSLSNTGGSQIYTNESIARAPSQTELVEVDRVDDILPQGTVVNFALIDVERLEVECLEGMKATIQRSPDIVIMCEWSGMSYNSQDILKKKTQILEWFSSLGFKFYQLGGYGGVCAPQKFLQLDMRGVLNIQGMHRLTDIYFVPKDIDPNTVF